MIKEKKNDMSSLQIVQIIQMTMGMGIIISWYLSFIRYGLMIDFCQQNIDSNHIL